MSTLTSEEDIAKFFWRAIDILVGLPSWVLRKMLLSDGVSERERALKLMVVQVLSARQDDPERIHNLFSIVTARVPRKYASEAAGELQSRYWDTLGASVQKIILDNLPRDSTRIMKGEGYVSRNSIHD